MKYPQRTVAIILIAALPVSLWSQDPKSLYASGNSKEGDIFRSLQEKTCYCFCGLFITHTDQDCEFACQEKDGKPFNLVARYEGCIVSIKAEDKFSCCRVIKMEALGKFSRIHSPPS